MEAPLRVLILEDNSDDAELLMLQLQDAGFAPHCSVAFDVEGYLAGLRKEPDIVIADYTLPQMTALDALRLMRESGTDIPLIVVSGVMDEETCVQALRHGAADYLLKDRLTRLGTAVSHALDQRALLAAQRRAERESADSAALLRAFVAAAPAAAYLTDLDGRFLLVNDQFSRLLGTGSHELLGTDSNSLAAPDSGMAFAERDRQCLRDRAVVRAEEAFGRGEQARHYLSTRFPLYQADGTPYAVAALYADITAQKRTENELRQARELLERQKRELVRQNEELTALDKLKSQFVATVSHELRTPLTSICGYAELLVEASLNPSEHRMVSVIEANGRRLLSLIEDLLTFARVEQGQLPLQLSPVDLGELVDRCIAVITPVATERGIAVGARVPDDVPMVRADRDQIERVLLNLLSNGVKFSPEGGDVSVDVCRSGREVTVAVIDTGIGIAAHEQHRLFTQFFRAAEAERRVIPGTGLGLALCKAIVEAHGGRIAAHSAEGVGTTIRFSLPAG